MHTTNCFPAATQSNSVQCTAVSGVLNREMIGKAQERISSQQARLWLVLCLRPYLSRNILSEVGEYLGSPLLPCLRGQFLYLIDLESRKASMCRLAIRFAHNYYYCLASPLQLLCFPYDSSQVCAIDLSNSAISPFPPMLIARSDPGAVVFDDCVYVFGGDLHKSNERYDPRLGKWVNLPHSHYCYFMFSPCVYLTNIYLPQPDLTEGQMDVYTPLYGTFALVQIPKQDFSRSIAFVDGASLVWLTAQGDFVQLYLETARVQVSRAAFEGSAVPGNSAPVRFGSLVYWTTPYGDQIYMFDTEKCAVDVLRLPSES